MCCWLSGVCLQVFRNLLKRIGEDIALGVYKMCAICSCCCCRWHRRRVDKSNFDENYSDNNYAYEYPTRECKDDSYKNVNRETAETLLESRQNGTFIIRPSMHSNAIGTLSVYQDGKVYHLPIRRRRDNHLALGTAKPNEKCFKDLNNLINYYISNYLILYSDNESVRALLLPYNATSNNANHEQQR